MNIWYVNPYAGGPGVGRYWRAYYLSREWMKAGHSVRVVTAAYHHLMDTKEPKSGEHVVDGVAYNYIPGVKYQGNGFLRFFSMIVFSIMFFFWGARQGFKDKPELIIYSSAHPFGYPFAWCLAKFFRCKIFFEVRDLWPLSLIDIAGFGRFHPVVIVLSMLEHFAYRTADAVISLLPGAKTYMQERGMLPSKFLYVPNGAVLNDICGSLHEEKGLVSDMKEFKRRGDFLFFYAGALGEPNAMHKFVDSLAHVKARGVRGIRFIVVGKGEQEFELKGRCRSLGYDFVDFYPQVDKRIVYSALAYADCGFFVMHDSPIYKYGVSLNKLYDYMSSCVPVVACYRPHNDAVSDAGCGVSVMPECPEALASAFIHMSGLDAARLKEMGSSGRAYFEKNFEYSVLASRILKFAV